MQNHPSFSLEKPSKEVSQCRDKRGHLLETSFQIPKKPGSVSLLFGRTLSVYPMALAVLGGQKAAQKRRRPGTNSYSFHIREACCKSSRAWTPLSPLNYSMLPLFHPNWPQFLERDSSYSLKLPIHVSARLHPTCPRGLSLGQTPSPTLISRRK